MNERPSDTVSGHLPAAVAAVFIAFAIIAFATAFGGCAGTNSATPEANGGANVIPPPKLSPPEIFNLENTSRTYFPAILVEGQAGARYDIHTVAVNGLPYDFIRPGDPTYFRKQVSLKKNAINEIEVVAIYKNNGRRARSIRVEQRDVTCEELGGMVFIENFKCGTPECEETALDIEAGFAQAFVEHNCFRVSIQRLNESGYMELIDRIMGDPTFVPESKPCPDCRVAPLHRFVGEAKIRQKRLVVNVNIQNIRTGEALCSVRYDTDAAALEENPHLISGLSREIYRRVFSQYLDKVLRFKSE